jgi:hypothetical protein
VVQIRHAWREASDIVPYWLSEFGISWLVGDSFLELYIYMITCSEAKQLEKSYSPNLMLYSN